MGRLYNTSINRKVPTLSVSTAAATSAAVSVATAPEFVALAQGINLKYKAGYGVLHGTFSS